MSVTEMTVSAWQVGRSIKTAYTFSLDEKGFFFNGKLRQLSECIEGNGRFKLIENRLVGTFNGKLGSYQARLKLIATEQVSNGVAVRFRVLGWSVLRYVAIGYTSIDGFEHVKIANLRQGEWLDFSYGFNDLINKIQNRWNITSEAYVNDLRVYVSGQPELHGARIEVESGACWLENTAHHPPVPAMNTALSQAIVDYFLVCHPETHEQAQQFLWNGNCPMTGELVLEWAGDQLRPELLQQTATFRYLWHACQPAMKLLVYALQFKQLPALFAARDMINSWLDSSFYQCDSDQKYTWYDHGVAERLLCLLLMQQAGLQHQFDQRFMNRLAHAIVAHTHLLESEAFYSCHQSTRYHNHAWFQDIGLMAAAVAYAETKDAVFWFQRGQKRLQDQINQLVKREGGYAVFIENSSGYHEGIQRLIRFAAQLEQMSQQKGMANKLLKELEAWSAIFTYPDGRLPAQGDTFRVPNPANLTPTILSNKPQCDVVLLPESGYFVHKGASSECSWFIGMVTTNSSQTHKHEDDSSLVFWLDGIEWLIDPSFYSHDYTDELPAYCRSALAHNMLSLPNHKYDIVPAPGRTSLKYVDSAAHNCRVEAINRSYQGFEIQRQLHFVVTEGLPHIEVIDQCKSTSNTQVDSNYNESDNLCTEHQVIIFHLGDGVEIVKLNSNKNVYLNVYELSHLATQRKLQLHLPVEIQAVSCQIEQQESVSGLQFLQSTVTTVIKLMCPIGVEVKWKIHVS